MNLYIFVTVCLAVLKVGGYISLTWLGVFLPVLLGIAIPFVIAFIVAFVVALAASRRR